jgi:hypothetical protein
MKTDALSARYETTSSSPSRSTSTRSTDVELDPPAPVVDHALGPCPR